MVYLKMCKSHQTPAESVKFSYGTKGYVVDLTLTNVDGIFQNKRSKKNY